ncbi:MAG: hypothetical protein Kow00121_65000 [Elainellaceae cyanobacterium]
MLLLYLQTPVAVVLGKFDQIISSTHNGAEIPKKRADRPTKCRQAIGKYADTHTPTTQTDLQQTYFLERRLFL